VGRGGQPGNRNAERHGFYGRHFTVEELAGLLALDPTAGPLDPEIAAARVSLRRVLAFLSREGKALSPGEFAAVTRLAFQGARTVARLLRDRRALSGDAADGFLAAIGQALDELGTELGVAL
jgi:hypothetical protein